MKLQKIIFSIGISELIETLWNVNKKFRRKNLSEIRELIETLWNVNIHLVHSVRHFYLELIETLWNVNINGSRWRTSKSWN